MTWQNPELRAIYPVGVLAKDEGQFSFAYLRKASDAQGFRPFAGFDNMQKIYRSDRLFDFFESRVLSAKRPDFAEYVTKLDLDIDHATPWELLVKSTGKTKGDTVQLFPVPRQHGDELRLPLLIAGTRHLMSKKVSYLEQEDGKYTPEELEELLSGLLSGEELEIVREHDNATSNVARLTLQSSRRPIGYLPEWIAEEVDTLIDQGQVKLFVKRVNPPEMGWHLRVLADLVISSADGPMFASDDWSLADQ
ncbi:HIRAN domain-containing protein [Leucobacter soli]|uniref:HIRAN domain-containing protein n=1 Tax=Leucobacter soli TaxID=2812850 RepID=UPI0036151C30